MPSKQHFDLTTIDIAPARRRLKARPVRVFARWAVAQPATAVLFVHGFVGEGIGTWKGFDTLAPEDRAFARTDLIFFQYDCLWTQIATSAGFLKEQIRTLLMAPARIVNSSFGIPIRDSQFHYRKLVIASHSTGAIVCRRALIELHRDRIHDRAGGTELCMVLYAPAHCGARPASLLTSLMTGRDWKINVASAAIKTFLPVVEELDADSRALKKLREDTEAELRRIGVRRNYFQAADVLRAQFDNIVNTDRFCIDPDLLPLPGETHTTVCKPEDLLQDKYKRLRRAATGS